MKNQEILDFLVNLSIPLWGYRKVRYRGLEKNTAQVFTLFARPIFIWPGGNWSQHEG